MPDSVSTSHPPLTDPEFSSKPPVSVGVNEIRPMSTEEMVQQTVEQGGLKLIKAVKTGPYNLEITIEGDNPEAVTSSQAKRFVYDARVGYGFENAGLDIGGGFFPVNGDDPDKPITPGDPVKYRRIFKLIRR